MAWRARTLSLDELLRFVGPMFGLLVDARGRPIALVHLASGERIES